VCRHPCSTKCNCPFAAAAAAAAAALRHQVCWHYCDDGTWKDLLVVFGGSSGSGLLNDTWLWDVNTSTWTEVNLIVVCLSLVSSVWRRQQQRPAERHLAVGRQHKHLD
jgi:hypothetical protein